MSKKKKKKSKFAADNRTICESILNDFQEEIAESPVEKFESVIPALIDNDLAVRIKGEDFLRGNIQSNLGYRVACKWMVDFNSKLRSRKRSLGDYEIGGKEYTFSSTDKEILELLDYQLDYGIHFAQINSTHYAILNVKYDAEARHFIQYELAIIGKKWRKWKKKYTELLNHYSQIASKERYEYISSIVDDSDFTYTIFKPFSRMVFEGKDNLLRYIDNWREKIADCYDKYKMIPKLTILLYGKPGTGKSSVAKAIANYLGIEAVVNIPPEYFASNVSSDGNTPSVRGRGSNKNSDAVYVIDDIDCVCESRESDGSRENTAIVANLLAFLDNPPTFYFKANNGIRYPVSILVATTNYFEKLDKAVIREGRFDLKMEMKEFDKDMAEEMCALYDLSLSDIVKNVTKDTRISPAYLQAKCMEHVSLSMKSID